MFTNLFRRRDERGVTAIEYGILASLIAVATITAVTLAGGALSTNFANLGNHLGNMGGSSSGCDSSGNYRGAQLWVEYLTYNDGAQATVDKNGTTWTSPVVDSDHQLADAYWQGILVANLGNADPDTASRLSTGLSARTGNYPWYMEYSDGSCRDTGGNMNPNCDQYNSYTGDFADFTWQKDTFYTDGQLTQYGDGETYWSPFSSYQDGSETSFSKGWDPKTDTSSFYSWTIDTSKHDLVWVSYNGFENPTNGTYLDGDGLSHIGYSTITKASGEHAVYLNPCKIGTYPARW